MSIQEKINQDLKQAMLDKNEAKKSLLRVIIGEFNRVDKIVDDAKATSILKKMVENAKEVGNEGEVVLLAEYLPQQLTEEKLSGIINYIIISNRYDVLKDASSMGKVMAKLKEGFAGQYDGKLASELIKKRLA